MSKYSDFLTMKLIERKRFDQKGMSDNLVLHFAEKFGHTKNLNVRTKVDLIAGIETLATMFNLSKAEFVTEILESALSEALERLDQQGEIQHYMYNYLKNMERNHGFVLKYDEDGNPVGIDLDVPRKESE